MKLPLHHKYNRTILKHLDQKVYNNQLLLPTLLLSNLVETRRRHLFRMSTCIRRDRLGQVQAVGQAELLSLLRVDCFVHATVSWKPWHHEGQPDLLSRVEVGCIVQGSWNEVGLVELAGSCCVPVRREPCR